jgi:hypothetical protein
MISETQYQQLIDYLDGKLTGEEQKEVEQQLTESRELRKTLQQLTEISGGIKRATTWKPSAALQTSFDAALQQEINSQQQSKSVWVWPVVYRVAAGLALAVLAGGIGFWARNEWREQQEVAQLRKELRETKQLMLSLMNNELSASQRMMGVSVANTVATPDDDITRALIEVLNSDPNTNVRLSALDALAKFYTEPRIKNALVQSLAHQREPVVQIALIQLLVHIKEKTIMPQLEEIINNQQSIKAVKDEARTALLKLS